MSTCNCCLITFLQMIIRVTMIIVSNNIRVTTNSEPSTYIWKILKIYPRKALVSLKRITSLAHKQHWAGKIQIFCTSTIRVIRKLLIIGDVIRLGCLTWMWTIGQLNLFWVNYKAVAGYFLVTLQIKTQLSILRALI